MSIKLDIDDKQLLTLTISGKYLFSEFEQLTRESTEVFQAHSKLDLLVIFDHFEGWEACEQWSDTTFEDSVESNIRKIAVVAEKDWHAQIEMFGLMDFQDWSFKFFTPEQLAQAREWLA